MWSFPNCGSSFSLPCLHQLRLPLNATVFREGWLTQTTSVFLTALGGWMPKITVWALLASSKATLWFAHSHILEASSRGHPHGVIPTGSSPCVHTQRAHRVIPVCTHSESPQGHPRVCTHLMSSHFLFSFNCSFKGCLQIGPRWGTGGAWGHSSADGIALSIKPLSFLSSPGLLPRTSARFLFPPQEGRPAPVPTSGGAA